MEGFSLDSRVASKCISVLSDPQALRRSLCAKSKELHGLHRRTQSHGRKWESMVLRGSAGVHMSSIIKRDFMTCCIVLICKLLDSDAGEAAWNYCGPQLHASCCAPLCVRHGHCSCSPRIFPISAPYPSQTPPFLLCKFICVMLASCRL